MADRIGNTFRFYFLGVPVLFLRGKDCNTIVSQFGHLIVVVEFGVGNLMDTGANRLDLAHAVLDGDLLGGEVKETVHIPIRMGDHDGNR